MSMKNPLTPAGIEPATFRFVAQHLNHCAKDRMPKKIFTNEVEGTRRSGRPRKRWKEEVERDLQVLGVRRWRELVADRKKWKDIVRQAKAQAHSGL